MSSWVRRAGWVALAVVVLAGCGRRGSRTEIDLGSGSVSLAQPDVETLIPAASDPDPDIRSWAVLELARLGPKAEPAIPALTKALADDHPNVRSSAAAALGKLGPAAASAAQGLAKALNAEDVDTRRYAAEALGK